MNSIQLVGRLGREPNTKFTQNALQYNTNSIAVEDSFKAQNGQWDKKTYWHTIVAWGKVAEKLAEQRKGQLVFVEGKLTSRTYDTKDGQKHHVTEVVINRVYPIATAQNAQIGSEQKSNSAGSEQIYSHQQEEIAF